MSNAQKSGMGIPRIAFEDSASESDVEQAFIFPFLTLESYLGISPQSIKTKEHLPIVLLDKGDHKRRYHPDYVIYSDTIPLVVVEAKSPAESALDGFREAQLYAHELNKKFPKDVDPCRKIISCNGRDLAFGDWNSNEATVIKICDILVGSDVLERLRSEFYWISLQEQSKIVLGKLYSENIFWPYEQLGENQVKIAKISSNSFSEELSPLLQRYFESENPQFERDIIEKAYVSSDETTKYERLFENFLRDRITPLSASNSKILEPSKTKEDKFTATIQDAKRYRDVPGYLQLIIGAVGSGKSTFLKRYFEFLLPLDLKKKTIFIYLDFNSAPDEIIEINNWICDEFISRVRTYERSHVNFEETSQLKSVFNVEIKSNEGAYRLLREASREEHDKRLAYDLLNWMADKTTFARALARYLGGDKQLNLVFAFDNVDRRDRESQLIIFQRAQWFKNLTRSFCIVALRDITFETYKTEPPLDTFAKSSNFYISPPRFVDMVRRRLDLAISSLVEEAGEILEYDIQGVGRVRYPKTRIGEFLNYIYVDLFRRKRKVTMILEGLAGRSARHALRMFASILRSGHLDVRQISNSMLTSGVSRIQEAQLIKSLMRTDYLYFSNDHGFIKNIYQFDSESKSKSHFLKFEILEFLIENRKKIGDARFEGFFSVAFLVDRLSKMGFPQTDVTKSLENLLFQNLIISDRMDTKGLMLSDLVRVHASGFIHARILAGRVEYIAACALVTPLVDQELSKTIGRFWHINTPHTDIRHHPKNKVTTLFIKYLEDQAVRHFSIYDYDKSLFLGTSSLLQRAREAMGFAEKGLPNEPSADVVSTFERLFIDEEVRG